MGHRMKTKPASMKVKKERQQPKTQTCGVCANPKWDANNRNYLGEPFCGRCKWSRFGRIVNGEGFVLKNMKACEHFVNADEIEAGV